MSHPAADRPGRPTDVRAEGAIEAAIDLGTNSFHLLVARVMADGHFDVIAKEKLVMVKFFAPWCGHCQAMAEDFKTAATELKGKAVLADVDATTEEELAKKFNIDGFPTLKVFANGEELTDYNGGRDKASMIKFIERATLPPFHEAADKAAVAKVAERVKKGADKAAVVKAAKVPVLILPGRLKP